MNATRTARSTRRTRCAVVAVAATVLALGTAFGAAPAYARDGEDHVEVGVPFNGPMLGHEDGEPIHYDLHAWLFVANPAGVLAPWNPKVTC